MGPSTRSHTCATSSASTGRVSPPDADRLLGTHPALDERIATSDAFHAPHLIDVEVAHALQRLAVGGSIGADRAADARLDLAALPLRRYAHGPFVERAWELRHHVSACDAMYVALAELLDVPLVTCDASLARAQGVRAQIEVYAPI